MTIRLHINPEREAAAGRLLARLVEDRFASRLLSHDPTLWGVSAVAEACRRLGWVHPFDASARVYAQACSLREELHAAGIDQIVLCGMGGSSLAAAAIAQAHGVPLRTLDSIHPNEVRRALDSELRRTAVVIASKSGQTIEPLMHASLFRRAYHAAGLNDRNHIVYVTDPGTPLARLTQQGYRVVLADAEVGGRFSALTAFGVVAPTLAGVDVERTLDEARAAHQLLFTDSRQNPALRLAAAIACSTPRHDTPQHATLLLDDAAAACCLGEWVEQLLAESTGKQGKGVLPIVLPRHAAELTRPPAHSMLMRTSIAKVAATGIEEAGEWDAILCAPLGAQFLLWQVATVALARLFGVNPFDQPDVEAAKLAARALMQSDEHACTASATNAAAITPAAAAAINQTPPPDPLPGDATLFRLLERAVPTGGYLALQAFVDRQSPAAARVVQLRERIVARLQHPVSLGWGPSYLHSTGQLHKGGPPLGVFVQLFDSSYEDLAVPESDDTLGALLRAQAAGDRAVLERRGRPVFTWTIEQLPVR